MVALDRRTHAQQDRQVPEQSAPSWALTVARTLRDWNLFYYRSARVYRCDTLDRREAGRAGVEVVEATEADASRLAPWQGSTPSEWLARLANGHVCLIARSESRDVGYMWITRGMHYMQEVDHVVDVSHDPKGAYLHDAYVLPEARKKGVFHALMAFARAWARARGLSTLYTAVALDNEISLRAIESEGFKEVIAQVTLVRVATYEWKRVRRLSDVADVLA